MKGSTGILADKVLESGAVTPRVTRSRFTEGSSDPAKTPLIGDTKAVKANPLDSMLTSEQHPSPAHDQSIRLDELSNPNEIADHDPLIVTCFHEIKGTTCVRPLEVESIRRAIKSKVEEAMLPEIVTGFAFWQWDLWVFCAGYKSAYLQADDPKLLATGADKDGSSLQFKSGTNTNYFRISNVAGSEIRSNTLRRESMMTEADEDVTQELPPLEVEEIIGDKEGTFKSNSLLHQPSVLLDESSRELLIRQSARILISIRKRSDPPVNSAEQPIMVFGPAIGPYHPLKRGDGSGVQTVSIEEIESYADADLDFLIGIEYCKTNGKLVTLKYLTKSRHMAALAKKVAEKCKDMARARPSWETYKLGQSRMGHLSNSCDATFSSGYCIISALKMDFFKSDYNCDWLVAKIRKAVRGRVISAVPSENWLNDIRHKRRRHIKLSSMGWSFGPAKDREKVFILVKLETPVQVGVTMSGGIRRYERVNVASSKHDEGGEWLSRQFVTDDEANFLINVERRTLTGEVNVIMGGVRGLPRMTELDECILRVTKSKYEAQFQGDIGVFMMTLSHDWPKDSNELKDEPILVVCQLGSFKGGDLLGRSFHPYEKGASTLRQAVGSLDVQLFLRPDLVINKPFRSSTNSWTLEVDNCPRDCNMSDVLDRLTDVEAKKTFAAIRMDRDKPANEFDRWYILLDSRAHPGNEVRMEGTLLLKEKAIVSPSKRRFRAPGKPSSKWEDEGNLRFYERLDGPRGDSRERDRSASNSRGRSSGGARAPTTQVQPASSTRPHNDWSNVPEYYKTEPPKRPVPRSLTSPGMLTSAVSSGDSLSSLTTFSSASSLSSKPLAPKGSNPKEEVELCKQFALGNCIRGLLCNYRHEPKEIKLTHLMNVR